MIKQKRSEIIFHGIVGYPTPSWSDFPGCAMIERWAAQLGGVWAQSDGIVDRSRLVGLAGIVEHDYPRSVEALSRLIATQLSMPFQSIDPEHETLPDVSDEPPDQPVAVLFLQPGSWQEAEDGTGSPRLDTPVGRVRKLLEDNFRSPSFVVLTTCRGLESLHAPLRRISGFSRFFELPCPSSEQLGKLFIESCHPSWLADDVRQHPRRVGLLLETNYEGYEGRVFARLFVQRIAFSGARRVTLKDLAFLHSVGAVESCRTLPMMDGFDERVAWHEAGHAAIAMLDSNGRHIPEYLTVVPRRNTLGFMTISREHCERRHLAYTRSMMLHDLRVALAGRATEEVIYGESEVSDLSVLDLERAAEVLKSGVLKYGFQFASDLPALPVLSSAAPSGDAEFASLQCSPAWREFLEHEYRIAFQIAQRNRPLIEAIQRRLLQDRALFREDLEGIWSAHKKEEPISCQTAA